MHLGADICLQTLDRIVEADGHPESMPQEISENLKLAPKIFKETCEIDWNQPAKRIYDFVRGLSPYPGAWTTLVSPDGKETMLKIFRTTKTDQKADGVGRITADRKHLYVMTADGMLQIDELQLAGKKRMDAVSFLNGMKDILAQTSVPEDKAEKYFVR
jgi:methionyl-tRNA formyltransferase